MLTPKDQEALFAKLHILHPTWTREFRSGYTHGVADEPVRLRPYVRPWKKFHKMREYDVGYLVGFVVTRGEDSYTSDWMTAALADRVEEVIREG